MPHRTRMTLAEWRAEGTRRANSEDARRWIFVCPSCGQEQRGQDFIDLGIPKWERYLAYSCVGRFNLNVPARADQVVGPGEPTAGFGCTYSGSGGLAPVELELVPGQVRPTFGFAP